MSNDVERAIALQEGQVIGDWWFNQDSANQFITLVTYATVRKMPSVRWKNAKRQWVDVPTAQAHYICDVIIANLQKIHGDDSVEVGQ